MIRIAWVSGKRCRGLMDGPKLEFATHGIVLLGENGTGKSSYIDVLEKVLVGRCGSLDTGDQGISWRSNATHVLASGQPEGQVAVEYPGGAATLDFGALPGTAAADLQAFLLATRSLPFVLRRRELLRFISAKPAERYTELEPALGLGAFQGFEDKLKARSTELKVRAQSVKVKATASERVARETFGLPDDSTLDEAACLAALNATLRLAGLPTLPSLADMDAAASAAQLALDALTSYSGGAHGEGVAAARGLVAAPGDIVAGARMRMERWKERLEEERLMEGHFHAEVLQVGAQWIREDLLDACPLCRGAIEREQVLEAIAHELDRHASYQVLVTEDEKARDTLEELLKKAVESLALLRDAWRVWKGAEEAWPGEAWEAEVVRQLERLREDVAHEAAGADLLELEKAATDAWLQVVDKAVALDRQSRPDGDKIVRLASACTAATAIRRDFRNAERAKRQCAALEESNRHVEAIAALAARARKETVQRLLSRVAATAKAYFARFHPAEALGNPKLVVREGANKSLALQSEFHGKEADPRGYFSDGHVDTLGLALFLALRRLYADTHPALRILVLDDVLQSIDGQHRLRIAEVLFTDFADHQLVVTTHDLLWFLELQSAQRVYAATLKVAYRRIARWTIETGPEIFDHARDAEWLASPQAALATPVNRIACAGTCFEEVLQHACDRMKVPVVFRMSGAPEIGPLWDGFRKSARKNAELWVRIEAAVLKVEAVRQLRNWTGAHWNYWAQGVTSGEAADLSEAVLAIRGAIYCETCQCFVAKHEGLNDLLACRNEHLRYRRAPPTAGPNT